MNIFDCWWALFGDRACTSARPKQVVWKDRSGAEPLRWCRGRPGRQVCSSARVLTHFSAGRAGTSRTLSLQRPRSRPPPPPRWPVALRIRHPAINTPILQARRKRRAGVLRAWLASSRSSRIIEDGVCIGAPLTPMRLFELIMTTGAAWKRVLMWHAFKPVFRVQGLGFRVRVEG
jgi:hypothetical protein